MKYELQHNLGAVDARCLNDNYGTQLSTKPADLAAGEVIELNERAHDYLVKTKKYTSLLEPASSVTGEAKKPAITAPAKQ